MTFFRANPSKIDNPRAPVLQALHVCFSRRRDNSIKRFNLPHLCDLVLNLEAIPSSVSLSMWQTNERSQNTAALSPNLCPHHPTFPRLCVPNISMNPQSQTRDKPSQTKADGFEARAQQGRISHGGAICASLL